MFVLDSSNNIWRNTSGSSWTQLAGASTDRLGNGGSQLLVRGIGDNKLYEWNGSVFTAKVTGSPNPIKTFANGPGDYWANSTATSGVNVYESN